MEKSTKGVPLIEQMEKWIPLVKKVVPLKMDFHCIARRSQETKSVDLIKTVVALYLMIILILCFVSNLTFNINFQLFFSFIGLRLNSTRVLIPPFGVVPFICITIM